MAFQLKQRESVNKGVRRIIRYQLYDALTANDDKAVHNIRVHCKKVRACLRLVRNSIGNPLYRRENRRIHNAMKPLTKVRDAEVLIKTLDWLSVHFSREITADDFSVIRKALQEHYRTVCEHALVQEHAFDAIAETIKSACDHLKDWPLNQKEWSTIHSGLEHSYRRNRRAFAKAKTDPTSENFHEWRKQAKYLWYQLLILEPAWPSGVKSWDKAFHKLTKALGDDHDLTVLRQTLTADSSAFGKNFDTLFLLIERRRQELQKRAFALGKQLYRDKPGHLTYRIEKHWRKWRG